MLIARGVAVAPSTVVTAVAVLPFCTTNSAWLAVAAARIWPDSVPDGPAAPAVKLVPVVDQASLDVALSLPATMKRPLAATQAAACTGRPRL